MGRFFYSRGGAISVIAKNSKALYNYNIGDKYEAGIMLKGTEVKSLRANGVNISDAYAVVTDGELFMYNFAISVYKDANISNHDPNTLKKLLMHKKEIKKLVGLVTIKGFSLIPLMLYFNNKNIAKVELALCRGKKQYDKREVIKKRDLARSYDRVIKSNLFT